MTQSSIEISQLPPLPNITGSGSTKATDLVPATDVTATTISSPGGTTYKYQQSEILAFYLESLGVTTYQACRLSSTAPLTATYTSGTAVSGEPGVGATLTNSGLQTALVLDGYVTVANDRVLIQFQTSNVQNGIYVVTTVGNSTTNWVLTRSQDFDYNNEVIQWATVNVNQGTLYAGTVFEETAPWDSVTDVIGTDAITFDPFTIASLSRILGTANQIVVTQVDNIDVISLANPLTFPGPITLGGLLNTNGYSVTNSLTNGNIPFSLNGSGLWSLNATQGINGISNDGTLSANSAILVPTQAAVKAYVDTVAGSGFIVIDACYSSTTANLAGYTYNNGASGVGATLTAGSNGAFTTDGTSPSLNARILVQYETNSAYNGVYTLTTVGNGSTPAVLTRATDYDTTAEIIPGTIVPVQYGTLNANSIWLETATVVTIGTDPIVFVTFIPPNLTNLFVTLSTTQTITGAKTFSSGDLKLGGSSSGSMIVNAPATATGTLTLGVAPTVQTFTSGSGTYTLPSSPAPLYIEVEMCGGGGGGGGSGTTGFGAGGNGTSTTFGTSLLTTAGGAGGGVNSDGGLGGVSTLNSPAYGYSSQGSQGNSGSNNAAVAVDVVGGGGGANAFGGAGPSGQSAGKNGLANSGGGGGGGAAPGVSGFNSFSGAGGGSGGYIDAFISSPSATYSYSIGAGGAGGHAGTSGSAGGAGGSGIIIVREYYA